MMLKELVNMMELDYIIPFKFHKCIEVHSIACCKNISDVELVHYNVGLWSKDIDYRSDELGVYLYDCSIYYLYEYQQKTNPQNLKIVINKLKRVIDISSDEVEIIFAIYAILHEVGHWVDFINSNKTSLEYYIKNKKDREESDKYLEKIRSMPENNYEKYKCGEIYAEMYKSIPAEKAADKYALENIKYRYELVKSKLSNV